MPFTIPASGKIAGQSGFVSDINAAYGALLAVAGINVQNSSYSGGADPSGNTDSAAAIQAAVNQAVSAGGGLVFIPAGTYKVGSTISCTAPGVYIAGAGIGATLLNFTGTGDCIRQTFSGTYSGLTTVGGGVLGMRIDGTNAGAGSSAYHGGDIESLRLDVFASNFSGAGSIGVHLDNSVHWTERGEFKIRTYNCATGVVFDQTGTGTNSFARCMADIFITNGGATFDGVVFQNGALLYDGRLSISGNFQSSSSPLTSAVLRLTGSGSGGSSAIRNSHLDIGVESAPAAAHAPITIAFGATSNVIARCYGVLDFSLSAVAFTPSNWTANGSFLGPIIGDSVLLGLSALTSTIALTGGLSLGTGTAPVSLSNGSTISTAGVAYANVTNGGAITGVIMQAGTYDGQVLWVTNHGAGSITFAASGTSHVADGVSDVISALTARTLIWDTGTSLWYRAG